MLLTYNVNNNKKKNNNNFPLGFQSKDGRWLSKLLQHPSQPLPNLFHAVACTGYSGDTEMPRELSHLPKVSSIVLTNYYFDFVLKNEV